MFWPSRDQLHFAEPARPFFVVTTMTPLAASVPYSVAADGPFTISMSSISSGLSVLSSEYDVLMLLPEFVVPELNRTPSTTQIGALFKLSDEMPRTRTVGAAPSWLGGRTITPGLFAV